MLTLYEREMLVPQRQHELRRDFRRSAVAGPALRERLANTLVALALRLAPSLRATRGEGRAITHAA
ncbi:MAG TPA: hypothetical protein VFW96_14725 [Thermomicrobiales bacterium]|nr:hypothetical protein [Thermomicrobiales bacterium]